MIKSSLTKCLVAVLSWALVLQVVPLACAAGPVVKSKHLDSLPEKTFGVAHIRDIPEMMARFKESAAYEAVEKFLESDAYKKIKMKHKQAEHIEKLCLSLFDGIPKAFTGEVTIAVLSFNKEEDEPDIAIMAEGSDMEFLKLVENVIAPAVTELGGPKVLIEKAGNLKKITTDKEKDDGEGMFYSAKGDQMLFSPFERVFDSIGDVDAPLSGNSLFKSSFSGHGVSPDMIAFVNLREILDFAGVDDENIAPLKISGITSIEGIALSAKSVKDGTLSEISLYAPDKLKGALALLNRPGSGPGMEKYVPEDYSYFFRISLGSFKGFYKEIAAFIEKDLGDDGAFFEIFQGGVAEMEENLGFSLEEDLLAGLGGQIGFAMKMPKVIGIPEMVAFIELKDANKIQKLIEKNTPPEMAFTKTEYKGVKIFTTVVAMVQPSYAFVDNYLVVGIAPGVIRDIVDAKASGKSLLTKEDYKTVFANLPRKGIMVAYQDTEAIFSTIMPIMMNRLMMGAPGGPIDVDEDFEDFEDLEEGEDEDIEDFEDDGDDLFFEIMPQIMALLQETLQDVPGSGSVVTVDESSIRIKQFSGFGTTKMAAPVLAGLLLPALFRARQSARRVKSLSTIKQIILAQKQYAMENDEKFAEKLSLLYPDYFSALDGFRHPSSKNEPITKKEQIDELADYEIFPGLDESFPSTYILIYEKDGLNREEGRNVGYIDGHASWLTDEALQDALKEQTREMKEKKEE